MYTTRQTVISRQRHWAYTRGIKLDGIHTQTVEENLFQPLTEASRAEFGSESGNELLAKMRAVDSSSALVCNVFDYWRGRPLEPLAAALGAPAGVDRLRFQQVYPASRGPMHPLDVLLDSDGFKPFAIEAVFTEPYYPYFSEDAFARSFFSDSGELWGKYGLPRCEALARRINASQEEFHVLDAPQLLKHILDLAEKFGRNFTLLYLWYDYHSSGGLTGAAEHRADIETFKRSLDGEIDFRAMTYRELFQKMQDNPTVDKAYLAYLAKRYFPMKASTRSS